MATESELRKKIEEARKQQTALAAAKREATEQLAWYKKNAARINERALKLIADEWSKSGGSDGARVVNDYREAAAEQLREEGREATSKARAAAQQAEPQASS